MVRRLLHAAESLPLAALSPQCKYRDGTERRDQRQRTEREASPLSEKNGHNARPERPGKQRLYTGGARAAVFLQDGHRWIWPGCGHHFRTEIDHSTDWQHLTVTAPGNGGPLCRRHNLFKNHRYRVTRDGTGHWHTTRPDGTEICPL